MVAGGEVAHSAGLGSWLVFSLGGAEETAWFPGETRTEFGPSSPPKVRNPEVLTERKRLGPSNDTVFLFVSLRRTVGSVTERKARFGGLFAGVPPQCHYAEDRRER